MSEPTAMARWEYLVASLNDTVPVSMLGTPIVGIPGMRDPEFPCAAFMPGPRPESGTCDTDGHYLCLECRERSTCEGCDQIHVRCECDSCEVCFGRVDECICVEEGEE